MCRVLINVCENNVTNSLHTHLFYWNEDISCSECFCPVFLLFQCTSLFSNWNCKTWQILRQLFRVQWLGLSISTYLHLIFDILSFEISSLMHLIFSLFRTWILQATLGRKIQFKLEIEFIKQNTYDIVPSSNARY